MLNIIKVELELIPDSDMHIFFEKYKRGGVYDPKQESKHTIYLDANNLYGYEISKFLPT